MKKILAIIAALALIMPNCTATETKEKTETAETVEVVKEEVAEPKTVKTSRSICDGVELINIYIRTADGPQNVSVIEADLGKWNLYLKPLFSEKGSSYLSNVQTLVEDNNAIGAINADFFRWGDDGGGSAIGYNVVDGELITTPCVDEEVAAVGMTEDNKFIFDYFKRNIEITTEDGETEEIQHINKYDDLDGLVLYDKNWGATSLGSHGNLIEVVVEDNEVIEVRSEMPPVKIPENGYILAGLSDLTPFITESLKVGTKVELDIEITPGHDCTHIIGGGTLLIKKGKKAEITHNVGGRNPRSAFAVDKSGEKVYFIAVDGREKDGSIGMTLTELQEFLLDMGVYNAINFDGGGSTQLVMRDMAKWEAEILNKPSQTPYRKVVNALGLMDKKYLRNHTADAYIERFEKDTSELYIYPRDVAAEYEVTGGKGKLTYDFTEESDKLLSAGFSLDTPAKISEKNSKISIDVYGSEDNKQWLRYMITDADGEVQRITIANEINWNGLKTITVRVPDDIKLPAKLTRIYMVQPNNETRSKGEVYFDNLSVTGQKALNLAVSAGVRNNNNMLTKITATGLGNEMNYYLENLVISGCETGTTISRKDGDVSELSGVSVVWCDDSAKALDKAAADVIIAISEEDPRDLGFAAKLEELALKGKEVYAVYCGNATAEELYGRVKYITLKITEPKLSHGTAGSDILSFFKEGNKIKYEIHDYKIW